MLQPTGTHRCTRFLNGKQVTLDPICRALISVLTASYYSKGVITFQQGYRTMPDYAATLPKWSQSKLQVTSQISQRNNRFKKKLKKLNQFIISVPYSELVKRCEDFVLFFLLYDSKLDIFAFWTVGQIEQPLEKL